MALGFLTPLAALLAAVVVAPLGVYVLRQRRQASIRAALGLEAPSRRSRLVLVAALAAIPGLLGLAAAQPVLESDRVRQERSNAEMFVVLDTSRSMLASAGPEDPTRFERAREFALRLNDELAVVPLGLVSMTDRVLPHVFPTTDRRVIAAALRDSMGIQRPPGSIAYTSVPSTTFDSLASIPLLNYFSPAARKRLLVVLTDGETRARERDLSAPYAREPRIATLFVRFWQEGERIYETGVAEDGYQPRDPDGAALRLVAAQVEGRVFSEDDAGAVTEAALEALGTGPTQERVIEGERRALMPWVTLAAVLPLGLVLVRRNV
ncbi:MAG: VWA domain-containing protein [Gaiellaceae bacterium]